jgi:hypothetical protein
MLGRRGRSQMAPAAATIYDLWSGRTFTGDPLRDPDEGWDYGATIGHIGQNMIPFYVDTAADMGGWGAAPATATEFLGFQSYKISDYDHLAKARNYAVMNWDTPKLKEWRKNQIRKGEHVGWTTLPEELQDEIDDFEPVSRSRLKEYEEAYGPIAKGFARNFRDYREKKSEHDLKQIQTLANASLSFERGDINGKEFSKIKSQAAYARREFSKAILAAPEFEELQQQFQLLRDEGSTNEMSFHGDILYEYWQADIVGADGNYNEDTNEFNFVAYKKLENEFRNTISTEDWQYIMNRRRQWTDQLPVVKEYDMAMEKLSPYYNIHNFIWKPGTRMNAIAKRYFEVSASKRAELQANHKVYRDIQNKVNAARLKYRDARPDIDYLLVKWWDVTPRHAETKSLKDRSEKLAWKKRQIESDTVYPWATPRSQDFDISPSGRVNVFSQ